MGVSGNFLFYFFLGGGVGLGGGVRFGGQGGCERRIEVFVKSQKKNWGGGGMLGVGGDVGYGDVNQE